MDPYPGCPNGALTRFFPLGIGLAHLLSGSALGTCSCKTISMQGLFSGLQSFLNVQASEFARHPDRSDRRRYPRPPWLLRPRISRFVTSPSSGYANRPNRAIDGRGTCTLQDLRPCRPLLEDIDVPATGGTAESSTMPDNVSTYQSEERRESIEGVLSPKDSLH